MINKQPLEYHSILNLNIYLPLPVSFVLSYVFMLLISVLLFQLEKLLSVFPIRQESAYLAFISEEQLCWINYSWLSIFFFQHIEYIITLLTVFQDFCWEIHFYLMGFPWIWWASFLLLLSNSFLVFDFWQSDYNLSQWSLLWIDSDGDLWVMYMHIHISPQIWEILSHYFIK